MWKTHGPVCQTRPGFECRNFAGNIARIWSWAKVQNDQQDQTQSDYNEWIKSSDRLVLWRFVRWRDYFSGSDKYMPTYKRRYRQATSPHVVVCLMGRFKCETGERKVLLPFASVATSAIKIRWWIEQLVQILGQLYLDLYQLWVLLLAPKYKGWVHFSHPFSKCANILLRGRSKLKKYMLRIFRIWVLISHLYIS